MPLTAAELHATAPLGSYVTYSDGTPRPPERHKNKLRQWESRNGSAYLTRVDAGDSSREYNRPRFTLTNDHGWLIVSKTCGLADDGVRYEFTPPRPGTILAYSDAGSSIEIVHIWPHLDAAKGWARGKGYNLANYGRKHFIVTETGERADYTPPAI